MTIYWVDEDDPQFEMDRERFRARGVQVSAIQNATRAYADLVVLDPSKITGLIIDVMLQPGADLKTFSPERCDGSRRVGLTLIEELLVNFTEYGNDPRNTLYDPKRNKIYGKVVIYTCATADDIVSAARAVQRKWRIPMLPKSPEIVGARFAQIILSYFKKGEIEDEFLRG